MAYGTTSLSCPTTVKASACWSPCQPRTPPHSLPSSLTSVPRPSIAGWTLWYPRGCSWSCPSKCLFPGKKGCAAQGIPVLLHSRNGELRLFVESVFGRTAGYVLWKLSLSPCSACLWWDNNDTQGKQAAVALEPIPRVQIHESVTISKVSFPVREVKNLHLVRVRTQ